MPIHVVPHIKTVDKYNMAFITKTYQKNQEILY
jgi:hypothetical protein